MKKLLLVGVVGLSVLIGGCASNPDNLSAQYVNDIQYKDYSCEQLASETANLNQRVSALHGQLDSEANKDAAQMAVGLVFLWPALFFLEGGDGPQAAEYSRLKGEKEAIDRAIVKKNCR